MTQTQAHESCFSTLQIPSSSRCRGLTYSQMVDLALQKKKIVSVLRNKYVEVKQSWKDQQSCGICWRNQWLIQRHEHLLNSEMSANYCGTYTGFRRGMLVKRTFLALIMFGWPDFMALIYFIWNCYVYFGIGKDLWWVIILKHCPRASTKCLLFYDVVPKSQRLIIWQ